MADHWEIIGGEASGGIQVRKGEELNSGVEDEKLSFGAVVKQAELNDKSGRLKYELIKGTGPAVGWISISLKSGKVLCVKTAAPETVSEPTPAAADSIGAGYQQAEQQPSITSNPASPIIDNAGDIRPVRQYAHPILIVGAGLGGCKAAVECLNSGRDNFIIVDTHEEFGGSTWLDAANATTKLQTEKATYHMYYLEPDVEPDPGLSTWPTRPQLREMFKNSARARNLQDHTRFNSHLDQVTVVGDTLKDGHYDCFINDWTKGKDYTVKASAVFSFPGVFHDFNEVTYDGEKQFGGYITYGSFDMCDYSKVEGQVCVIIGHGGFTIENVRTLVEKKASKIYVVCRKRNFTGMKVASWLVSSFEIPIPGNHLLRIMQTMYDIIGVDLWSHPHVSTNKERSWAVITQSNTFGVNDVYFLAEAYGLMEVREDHVTKLGPKCIYLQKTDPIEASVIVKCCGSSPSTEVDRILNLKELVGLWVNGDPLMPVITVGGGVKAKNYASFSSGPGYAGFLKATYYFIDYPEDFAKVKDDLPINVAKVGGKPGHYPDQFAILLTMSILGQKLPELARRQGVADTIKAKKTQRMHKIEDYLGECEAEWKMYDKMMRDNGQIPADKAFQPYPFTKEVTQRLVDGVVEEFQIYLDKHGAQSDLLDRWKRN